MRTCTQCGVIGETLEDLEDTFLRDSNCKYGYRNFCLECRRIQYKLYNINAESKRMSRYGITEQAYDEMLKLQNNSCAICGTHQSKMRKSLSIDHCHSTGQIRGLLCQACNLTLGHARDNIDVLNSAIKYLSKER